MKPDEVRLPDDSSPACKAIPKRLVVRFGTKPIIYII